MIWFVRYTRDIELLRIVQAIMKQNQYKAVLRNNLLSQQEEWFPEGRLAFLCTILPLVIEPKILPKFNGPIISKHYLGLGIRLILIQ